MTRVAAIDCGTNSIRLLVAEPDGPEGSLRVVDRRLEIVRLGQGVDATGRFAEDALDRTFAACERYGEVMSAFDVQRARFCATSAARDASNGGVFAAGVLSRLGLEVEVLSGKEEAALSYAGAVRGLPAGGGLRPPYLLVDIGGGSTELVVGDADGRMLGMQSVDVGSVRMTERHLRVDPASMPAVAAARREVDAALDTLSVPLSAARTLVGVAGTVTTVAAMVLDLPAYDSAAIHAARLPLAEVVAAGDRLLAMTREQRRDLPFMHPGRADVIGAGALVLQQVIAQVAPVLAEPVLVASEHDILDGIAASLVQP